MTALFQIPTQNWVESFSDKTRQAAVEALESGDVLFFPNLPFQVGADEAQFVTPAIEGRSKNASFHIGTGQLRGTSLAESDAIPLRNMMARFASQTQALMLNLLPDYRGHLKHGRTSFRPAEVAGRVTSWRLGEDFPEVAARFLPSIPKPKFGSSFALNALHITKSKRTHYDHIMLQLHDRMKADMDYQVQAERMKYDFPANTTWAVFTDQASHAAMAGQFMLEQTFYLPVDGMHHPEKSPLKILEKMRGQSLI